MNADHASHTRGLRPRSPGRTAAVYAFASTLTVLLAGCGGGGGGERSEPEPGSYVVVGHVADKGTQAPIVGATVAITQANGKTTVGHTDSSGNFRLTFGSDPFAGAPPSQKTISIDASDLHPSYYTASPMVGDACARDSTAIPVPPLAPGENDIGTVLLYSKDGPPPPPCLEG